jgi:2-C-methyl-D-erythritol 4-phosphate cytidylyltransferase/2-C-methyl-D-erythritol 2,4-cyclodiphosphate synthase
MIRLKQKTIFGLIVAAGAGTRVGGQRPKQYHLVGGESILSRAIKPFLCHSDITGVVVVISKTDEALFIECCGHLKNVTFVFGGENRQQSVHLGLESLSEHNPDCVLIHDGARPFLPARVINDILLQLETEVCVIPVLQINDSLKRTKNGRIIETIDRTNHLRTQTPQGFRYSSILQAHRDNSQLSLSDDAALFEGNGNTLATVDGSDSLFKITYSCDLEKAGKYIAFNYEYRTGIGFDVHKLGPGNNIILCGIELPHNTALIGHSDADVSFHAITDALLGAMAEGDIGDHFPPTEEQWKDVSSEIFLQKAIELLSTKNGEIVNVDVTIICELPKIKPFKFQMRQNLSEVLQTPLKNISIKATTTEGLGAIGRKEGIATQATVTIRLPY